MGLLKNTMISMGLAQPGPKITPQDKAILEYVWSHLPLAPPCLLHRYGELTSSLKIQRDKMKQYQKRVRRTSMQCLHVLMPCSYKLCWIESRR